MITDKEYLMCAAIHVKDGKEHPHQPINIVSGFVVCGRRHHNCLTTLTLIDPKLHMKATYGFLTSENRFVNRAEARSIAIECGQYTHETTLPNELFSEDVW